MSKKSHPGDGDKGQGVRGEKAEYRPLFEIYTIASGKTHSIPKIRIKLGRIISR